VPGFAAPFNSLFHVRADADEHASTGVTPSRHAWRMTDDEVISEAAVEGFELEERTCQDAWF